MSRIAVICPRNMHFGPKAATSIDLCVHDFTQFSRYRNEISIFGHALPEPYADVDFRPLALKSGEGHRQWANRLIYTLTDYQPDLVEVQQHLPTASILARRLNHVPVLLHRHNFVKVPQNLIKKIYYRHRLAPLEGFIFVSHATRNKFCAVYPEFRSKAFVVYNGIDTLAYELPDYQDKKNIVLFVGRMAPEKGVLEFAKAVAQVLPSFEEWKAIIITGGGQAHDAYACEVHASLAHAGEQAQVLGPLSHDQVMNWYRRAAIACVPSKYEESFGRTALEAMITGNALISSGTGGLREVSGDCALYLDAVTPQAIAAALERLIVDEPLRQSLQTAGWQRARELFDIRIRATQLDNVYRRYLANL